MSDWFGTQSTAASVNAGLDLEMPGPANWRGEKLLQAVEQGEVSEATIDASVRRLLRLIERAGAFDHPDTGPEQAIDRPEHRAVAREAAAEGIVLLKNADEALPLQSEKLGSLALIGPNAKTARIMAGGSAQVNAHYAITPFEAIAARVGDGIRVGYEPGCTIHKLLPLIEAHLLNTETGEQGLALDYFNTPDFSGSPVAHALSGSSALLWLGNLPPEVNPQQFSVRATARFTPEASGLYSFGLVSAGLSRLWLDGQEIVDNWTHQEPGEAFFGMGSTEAQAAIELTAGQTCTLTLEYSKGSAPIAAVRLGCLAPQPADSLERAVALAASSDVALLFVGLSEEWESEGFDRPNLELAGKQRELIEAVAAANPRTIVVLNTGSPIAMPWLNKVAAVLEAWYPGQECGNAIADVLFGAVNPSGKLTETFPQRLQDNPAYINYPGENGQVRYGEGIFVGYRYYEKKQIAPLFPFGFGLSYTTFTYCGLRLSAQTLAPDQALEVSIDVTNTGKRAGHEVVQLYIRDTVASVQRPEKELKAFAKLHLEVGAKQTVTFSVTRESLAYYDIQQRAWVAEAGEFEVLVGSSSQDIHATGIFTLTETSSFGGASHKGKARLGLDSTLGELLGDPRAYAALIKYLPAQFDLRQVSVVHNWRLEQIAAVAPDILTPEILQSMARDLEQLDDRS
jgi:beta-glucosidase